nr:MAG TPA: hypothetical protein [Caudoviricetes sp.]
MAVLFLSTSRKWCFLISTRLSNAYLIASCRINKLYYYDYVSDTVKSVRRKLYKRDRLLKVQA